MNRTRRTLPVVALFLVVLGVELAFGLWMNARDFRWLDGISRAVNALVMVHGADPHLAAVGFVWMPLPTFVEAVWVLLYPVWPDVIASGFASTMTSALGAAIAAVIVLLTARRLELSDRFGVLFAVVVAANPMLLLFGANGMSEGMASPFLIGAVCALTLFWHTGQRRYVALAGISLAVAFLSVYEAAPFGVALGVALVMVVLWGPETAGPPSDRRHTASALLLVLALPATYVGLLWVAANAVIMGDPLNFATGEHSNKGLTEHGGAGIGGEMRGDVLGALEFTAVRTAPFLVPVVALLAVRTLDRRFWRLHTLALVLLTLSVPIGLIAPLLYMGNSWGWLRFFMYPLMVAAGWGLYEVAASHRRRRAAATVLAGWVLATPAILAAMATERLGQEEHLIVRGIATGQNGADVGYGGDPIRAARGLAASLEDGPLRRREWVLLDQTAGFPIAGRVRAEHLDRLLLTPDRIFYPALRAPAAHGVRYLLVPNPEKSPRDAVVRVYPRLWNGRDRRFRLVRALAGQGLDWRLYALRGRVAAPSALDRARARLQP
jgi:hypothetical protein